VLEDQMPSDLRPSNLKVYGYMVTYRKNGTWTTDPDDEYSNLPAHYPFMQQAIDRAEFLRTRGIECRVSALLAEPTDTPEEFERSKIDGDEPTAD
jgi:hypothetical protein